MRRSPAVFLDRDGTIIEQVHHLVDPQDVRLLPAAVVGLRQLQSREFKLVVITNQSVIARGLLDEVGLLAVHAEMLRQLAAESVVIDGIYFCPLAPDGADQRVVEHADRKPGPGMLLRAAQELDLELSASWMVGDMISDMLAGRNAGVRGTIGVRTGHGCRFEVSDPAIDFLVDDLAAAAEVILGHQSQ